MIEKININLDRGEHWDTYAACGELLRGDPITFDEYFYPEENTCKALTKMAKRICAACPVRVECLEDALANNDRFGIKGGLSPREREIFLRRRRGENVIPFQREPSDAS